MNWKIKIFSLREECTGSFARCTRPSVDLNRYEIFLTPENYEEQVLHFRKTRWLPVEITGLVVYNGKEFLQKFIEGEEGTTVHLYLLNEDNIPVERWQLHEVKVLRSEGADIELGYSTCNYQSL